MDTAQPTFAAQVFRPLARLIEGLPEIPDELKSQLRALDAVGERVPLSTARELWYTAIRTTRDPDLGLRAALHSIPSDFEVFEWLANSAATWADACRALCRYVRVLNEAADYRVEICGTKAHIILGSNLSLTREMRDFAMAVHYLGIKRWFPERWPDLAIWLKHDEPADTSGYRAVFPNCRLVFRAAFDGYVYDAWRLNSPLPTADQQRHDRLCRQIDRLLQTEGSADTWIEWVSCEVVKAMHEGRDSAERTASRLGISRRTLVRRLREHGTSYSKVLQEVRHRTALHYLHNTELSAEDIAVLLGYAECAPFIRAFRRWSGRTPQAYRRYYRRTSSALSAAT